MITYKFRGKQYKTGEWLVGDLIHFHHDVMILPLEANWYDFVPRKDNPCRLPSDRFVVDPETVGQFSTLKDKKGREIFAGDILAINGVEEKLEVRFVRGVFAFLWNGDFDNEFPTCSPTHEWAEVVGNIHDNPELIKKGGNDESDVH